MDKQLAVQLHAANVVDIIGEGARPLLPQMKAAMEAEPKRPYYIPGLHLVLPRVISILKIP